VRLTLLLPVLLVSCAKPVPSYTGEGAELVGRTWSADGLRWIDARPAPGRVTLVRWWTNG
jgi:hypothetical protein